MKLWEPSELVKLRLHLTQMYYRVIIDMLPVALYPSFLVLCKHLGDLALLPPQSGSGLWEIKFKATDCPTALGPTGYIQFRFTGSNEMYFKLQAMNAK